MENTLLVNDLVEQREGFVINDLNGATWAFRKLRAIDIKKAEIEKIAGEEEARIEAWKQQELKQYESDEEYFKGLIAEYYKAEREKDSKFKLSTPYGKVTARNTDKWFYDDEEKLKEYLKANKIKALRVIDEVDKTSLKSMFKNGVNTETGEILPGVRIEKVESISIKAE